MKEKFTCNICGKDHDDLDSYMKCVSKCGEKVLKEREAEAAQKYLEEVNMGLNRIKEAEKYLESVKKEFKEKYPEEYDLNFGVVACEDHNLCNDNSCSDCDEGCPCEGENCDCRIEHGCKGDGNCYSHKDSNVDTNSIEFYYTDNGKDKPKLSARVNGIKVDDDSIEKLFEDPEVNHLARLIGIL